jgi:hypothetical protein
MLAWSSLVFTVLSAGVVTGTGSQGPQGNGVGPEQAAVRSYVSILSQLPWDVAKDGPMVAPAPRRAGAGANLDELGLRKIKIGTLTAIVPKMMATVNSRFTAAPNLYEGMPRDAKMLYLLRSLSPIQWTKVSGDGLSIDDCQGEQRAVFESILPNPLSYSMGTLGDGGRSITSPRDDSEVKTLTGSERSKVKLRVVRHLQVEVSMENDGGWTGTEPEGEFKNGTRIPHLIEKKDSGFGHEVIVRSPNQPRKSHLDLQDQRLGAEIPFKSEETVEALLGRIGAATGVSFISDPHYAQTIMIERGTSAPARDVLAALSLGVTGTYRRVGDTYVLTADLEGMGAHQVRVALWEDTLRKIVDERSREWRQQIVKSGGLGKVQFRSPAYDGLTEAEKANLEANDRPKNQPHFIPIDQASEPIQNAIKNWSYGNKIDRNRVGVSSSIRLQILLPGVGRTWWQGWLGNTEEYNRPPYPAWAPLNPPPVALPFDHRGAVQGLVLRADTAADAKAHVARAARVGVAELWLETRSAEALKAAVVAAEATKVRVALAIRPWEVPAGTNGIVPDRTVTGEHGRALATGKQGIELWWNFWQDIQAFEPPTQELMAPLDPSTGPTIARLAQLAKTPGIAKIVVLDLFPNGYGRAESNMSGSYFYSNALDAYLSYGYTEAMRSVYLKQEKVDPIDLETQMIHTDIQFGPAWGEEFTHGQGFDQWQKAKGLWSHERADALAKALAQSGASLPILVPGEPTINHLPPLSTTYLYRWHGTEELPLAPVNFGGGPVPEESEVGILDLTEERDPGQRNRVASRLKEMIEKPKKPVVLDFSSIPKARLDAALSGWLRTSRP